MIFIIFIFCIFKNICLQDKYGYSSESDLYEYPKILNNFITEFEANYFIKKAENNLEKSATIGKGKDKYKDRKSNQYWLSKNDPIGKKLINKIGLPFENAEDIQIVKYNKGGYYKSHHDSCCDNNKECRQFNKFSGHRTRTILIWLNDNFKGGGTEFPNLKKVFYPKKYDALMFYPLDKKNKKCHPYALHGGMNIEEGEKWIATIWFRQRKF